MVGFGSGLHRPDLLPVAWTIPNLVRAINKSNSNPEKLCFKGIFDNDEGIF